MIWATVSFRSCFCLLYRASPSLVAKNIINLILLLTIWWCPCVVFSCVIGRGCLLWSEHFLGKILLAFTLLHSIIQVYAQTSNAEEAEVKRFYEDLQDLLELTPKKDVLFIIGDWNAKVGSQETPGVTGKFGLGVQNEAGQRLIEFCQENALVTTNTHFQQHKRRLDTCTSPDGQHQNQVYYILCSQRWRSFM